MVWTVHDLHIVWVCRAVVVQCRSAHMPVERQFPPDRRTESSSIFYSQVLATSGAQSEKILF